MKTTKMKSQDRRIERMFGWFGHMVDDLLRPLDNERKFRAWKNLVSEQNQQRHFKFLKSCR